MKKKALRKAGKKRKRAYLHPAPKSKNAALRRHKVRLAKKHASSNADDSS